MTMDRVNNAIYNVVDIGQTAAFVAGLLILVLLINEGAEAIDRWVDRDKDAE